MSDNNYSMLSLFEFTYSEPDRIYNILRMCRQIENEGFDPNKEFCNFTLSSIMTDSSINSSKKKEKCKIANCKKGSLRNNICRKHLLEDANNVCQIRSCKNIKYKFHKGSKKNTLDSYCSTHRRAIAFNKLLINN